MKRSLLLLPLVLGSLLLNNNAPAAQRTWANTGTDFNASASWTGGVAPGSGDVAFFNAAEVTQPNVSSSTIIAGLYFSGTASSGYDITGSAGVVLGLNGVGSTGSGGTSTGSAAAIRGENTSGTNTIDVNLSLAGATSPQVFYQALGGTLVVNGTITGTNTLSLKGASSGLAGTIQLNGSNTGFSGGVTINDPVTLVIGNDNALGTGTFTNSSGTSTIQASASGARSISNNFVVGGVTTFGGTNAITFTGTASTSGANSRTITVNTTNGIAFNNTFTINGNSAAGTALFNGTSNVTFNGVIQDGNFAGGILSHGGTGTMTLANMNTYTGGTTLSGGTTIATANGAFGTGNVSLTASNVTLTLQGVTQAIAPTATLSIGLIGNTGDVVNLNFTGTQIVSQLNINGVAQQAGIYGAAFNNPNNIFAGMGTITVIPEPATYMLMGVGLLICAQTFRRKRS